MFSTSFRVPCEIELGALHITRFPRRICFGLPVVIGTHRFSQHLGVVDISLCQHVAKKSQWTLYSVSDRSLTDRFLFIFVTQSSHFQSYEKGWGSL